MGCVICELIARDSFVLWYPPKVLAEVGAEALLQYLRGHLNHLLRGFGFLERAKFLVLTIW